MKKVLITGGSGLLGTRITDLLLAKKIKVVHLTTNKSYKRKGVKVCFWNLKNQFIEEGAFDGVSHVMHLAGAGVVDKNWSAERKKELIDSRVHSTQLVLNNLKAEPNEVVKLIGASAVGYYGNNNQLEFEDNAFGNNFLADVCRLWEESYNLSDNFIDKVVFRIGIVLSDRGGALKEMMKTLPFFVGVLANGKQIYSWIHIDDLARMFIESMLHPEWKGIYNAVGPNPISQKEIAHKIANMRGTITMPAPKIALKLMMGEMSDAITLGVNCSSQKIENAGFQFQFQTIDEALTDLV